MDSNIVLQNDVVLFFFIELILFSLQIVSLFFVIKILKNWNFNSSTSLQYSLEDKTYLVSLSIGFLAICKIIILPYFVYILDKLNTLLPGAMCATGVIGSGSFGNELLFLKLVLLFLFLVWISIHSLDMKYKGYKYLHKKYYLYLLLFILGSIEVFLEFSFFSSLSTKSIATCCSVVFNSSQSYFDFEISTFIYMFYILYFAILLFNYKKYTTLLAISNLLFIFVAYYCVVYFFGIYIYELPTHHCPFCLMQKDYNYVGYMIFASLFIGSFLSLSNFILKLFIDKTIDNYYKYSNILLSIFVVLVTSYVLLYYFENRVWL